jgi:hypothetical protein
MIEACPREPEGQSGLLGTNSTHSTSRRHSVMSALWAGNGAKGVHHIRPDTPDPVYSSGVACTRLSASQSLQPDLAACQRHPAELASLGRLPHSLLPGPDGRGGQVRPDGDELLRGRAACAVGAGAGEIGGSALQAAPGRYPGRRGCKVCMAEATGLQARCRQAVNYIRCGACDVPCWVALQVVVAYEQ